MLPETESPGESGQGLPPSSFACLHSGAWATPRPAPEGRAPLCLQERRGQTHPDREVSRRPWQVHASSSEGERPTPPGRSGQSGSLGTLSGRCLCRTGLGGDHRDYTGSARVSGICFQVFAFSSQSPHTWPTSTKCRPSSTQTVKTRTGKARCS